MSRKRNRTPGRGYHASWRPSGVPAQSGTGEAVAVSLRAPRAGECGTMVPGEASDATGDGSARAPPPSNPFGAVERDTADGPFRHYGGDRP